MNWRLEAKRAVEWLLVTSGVANRAITQAGRNGVVLAFHNIVADGARVAGDRSLHMPRGLFAGMIRELSRRGAFVPLDEMVWSASTTRSLHFAVTFDDAYLGAVTHGIDVLHALHVPATVFVAPGLLGQASTWWDDIGEYFGGEIPPLKRDVWLDGPAAGRADAIRAEFAITDGAHDAGRRAAVGDAAVIASREQLLRAAQHDGVTLGSHTWSHPNLAALASNPTLAQVLHEELTQPLEWLRQSGARMVPMLAYPYGRWSDAAANAVSAAGYRAAFRVDGGALGSIAQTPFALPRINVPAAMSANGLLLRVAGLR